MRVLIIEDDIPLGNFLRSGLSAERYQVDVATDGEQGSRMGTSNDYDLMLLDLQLPKMPGLQVLSSIRASKPSVPILVLSALSKLDNRVQVIDAGADDYLTKPFPSRNCWRDAVRC